MGYVSKYGYLIAIYSYIMIDRYKVGYITYREFVTAIYSYIIMYRYKSVTSPII